MRFLVACQACHRQFDASGIAAGSRFRCTCGKVVQVPEPRAHEAAVVRCSSCGGPRQGTGNTCGWCQADFTLREQDLEVMCPSCMARVSSRARFCHHCATPIAPEGDAGTPTRLACPACDGSRPLNSRQLGQQKMAVLECPTCAGIWLGHDAFELVLERARERALPEGTVRAENPPAETGQGRRMYRPCPHCKQAMNRQNFGRRSGVIVDRCREHGLWFDAGELEGVLRWIKKGGEERAQRREAESAREAARHERVKALRDKLGSGTVQTLTRSSRDESGLGGLAELFGAVFDL